jgi:hypothetical protein
MKHKTETKKDELRRLVNGILCADEKPAAFDALAARLAEILRAKDEGWKRRTPLEDAVSQSPQGDPSLHDDEDIMLEEIYWDLFREKQITFRHNDTTAFLIHSEASKL